VLALQVVCGRNWTMLFVPESTMVCRRKLGFSVLCKMRIECINVCLDLRNECLQSQRMKRRSKGNREKLPRLAYDVEILRGGNKT
jgi:hypothetical protein